MCMRVHVHAHLTASPQQCFLGQQCDSRLVFYHKCAFLYLFKNIRMLFCFYVFAGYMYFQILRRACPSTLVGHSQLRRLPGLSSHWVSEAHSAWAVLLSGRVHCPCWFCAIASVLSFQLSHSKHGCLVLKTKPWIYARCKNFREKT